MILISWVLVAVNIVSVFLTIKKKASGFLIGAIADVVWVYIDTMNKNYSQAATFLIFVLFLLYGFFVWKNDRENAP